MANEKLIPESIRDLRAKAMNAVYDRLMTLDLRKLLVCHIDTVDASALEELAKEFGVYDPEWTFADTEQKKRTLIKDAIELHKYRGTPWAVRSIFTKMGLSGIVEEWFEYGGVPARFKMTVTVPQTGINEVQMSLLNRLIEKYKNKRSILELLRLLNSQTNTVPHHTVVTLGGGEGIVHPKDGPERGLATMAAVTAADSATEIMPAEFAYCYQDPQTVAMLSGDAGPDDMISELNGAVCRLNSPLKAVYLTGNFQ
ncbi:MAG TPA: phage tail protein I [bacterium]|nr:phage tail protein I [bacterium]